MKKLYTTIALALCCTAVIGQFKPKPQKGANGKWGFVEDKTDGKEIVPFMYDDVNGFSGAVWGYKGSGLASVKINGKWGFIDDKGKVVIPLKYDYAFGFDVGGLAPVNLGGKWGFVNSEGKEVIPFAYHETSGFRNGLAAVNTFNKWGFINLSGQIMVPLKYDEVRSFGMENLARVKLNDQWGLVDKTGKEITLLKFDKIDDFKEACAIVTIGGKYGLINLKGEEVIPVKYTELGEYVGNLAFFNLNGKFGYLNKANQEVIPAQYDYAASFIGDEAVVKLNGLTYLIDRDGNKLTTAKTSAASNTPSANSAGLGVFDYRKNKNTLGTGDEKTYLFQSRCRSGNNTFNVISYVTTDISKHDLAEMKSSAVKTLSNNAWQVQTEPKYLGLENEVVLSGKAGRDYVISSASIY